ncbi:MAG: protease HtpX, partial [Candidatus Omnitrophica bacterium]|nr:protease HtpX [Candidatus Omnitrophota bacterium]
MNYFKTGLLLVVLTMIFILIGGYFGGQQGAIFAFIFAFIMNMVSYWFSDKIVLMMYRAKEANINEVPELYNLVKDLTMAAQMPMPKVYIAPQNTPNAFA